MEWWEMWKAADNWACLWPEDYIDRLLMTVLGPQTFDR